MRSYMSTTDYAKAIRNDLKAEFPELGFSVRKNDNHISISLMSAPKNPLVDNKGQHVDVNQYYIADSQHLNTYGKNLFKSVKGIVGRYHWDESRIEIDYFSCAFYYSLEVGQWDKPFVVK